MDIKTTKKINGVIISLIMIVSLAGCSSKGTKSGDPNIGRWKDAGYYVINKAIESGETVMAEELKVLGMLAYVLLNEDGTFVTSFGEDDVDTGTWEKGILNFINEDDEIEDSVAYKLKGDEMTIDWGGDFVAVYVRSKDKPATDTIEEKKLSEVQQWWDGEWFGYLEVNSMTDAYQHLGDEWADCYAKIEINPDDTGSIYLWDLFEDFAAVEIKLSPGGAVGKKGAAISESGYYWNGDKIGHADWTIDPDIYDYGDYMVIDGRYEDADGEGFNYLAYLKPWGVLWDDTPGGKRPFWYKSNYEERSMLDILQDHNKYIHTALQPTKEISVSIPDLNTEAGIKEYLTGEWTFDKEYVSGIVAKITIDKNLNITFAFKDADSNSSRGDFKGKIIFDRIYADPKEAPDLISIELTDSDYPGGDFFFKHRTVYDEKIAMSWFFAGNGNCIFDMLGSEDYAYTPDEIVLEKATQERSQLLPHKNEEFQAVFWGKGADGKSVWLDDIQSVKEEEEFAALYPWSMTRYENNVTESILYHIEKNQVAEILGDDLFPGEVYFIKTDENGYIIEFIEPSYKAFLEGSDEEEYQGDAYGFDYFQNSDIGKIKVIKSNNGAEVVKKTGPFTVTVKDVQVLQFELFDDFKEEFDNKDHLTFITMDVVVENNGTETSFIYPLLGTIVTNTNEQVEVDHMLSDSVGGEFQPGDVQEGKSIFQLDTKSKDVKNIRYKIDGAKDKDYNLVSKGVEFDIEF